MSRLVDVDELKHELKWLEEYDPPVYHDVASTIDEMPTVDAVEVVRCKDCIHKPTRKRSKPRYNFSRTRLQMPL